MKRNRVLWIALLLAALPSCGPGPTAPPSPAPSPTPAATLPPTLPPPTVRPRPTATTAPQSGQVYRNDVYGYEVRYPAGWMPWGNQEPWYPVQVFQGPTYLWLDVQNNLEALPLEDWLAREGTALLGSGVAQDVRPISVQGVAGLRFVWHDPAGQYPDQDYAVLDREGFVYVLRMDSTEYSELFTQVVESFRLIEASLVLPTAAHAIIAEPARRVIDALRERDFARLSTYVHPERGVLLSPYAFINEEFDRTFSAAQIRQIADDSRTYLWGYYDGSGLPIEMTFAEYYERFVYSQDFASMEQVGYNQIIGRGNTINNQFAIFPRAIVVEYYFPGADPNLAGMDWESLRLVFQEDGGTWYLVAIVHDAWTI